MKLMPKVNLSNTLKNDISLRFEEALGAIALIVIITDGYLANIEVSLLSTILSRIELFSNYPSQVIERMFNKVLTIFNQNGVEILWKMAVKGVHHYLYNSDFALTTDVLLADFDVSEEKEQLLINLCNYLEIPEGKTGEIFQIMLKNQRL
ncbi:MAG: tellurite resistance TerB family protein [Microcoleaceae cyanobacterium MO_207.B10]|nr:tellurite resistance TerB family protein [Microcoleaceae cyanobacterium MO_207.B10]